MSRQTKKLQSTGESLAQMESRVQSQASLAQGPAMQEHLEVTKPATNPSPARQLFIDKAGKLRMEVNGDQDFDAEAREFSSHGVGWYFNGRCLLPGKTGTRKENWGAEAPAIKVKVGDTSMTAFPRKFSSGSVGWNISQKIQIGSFPIQVSLNITVIGSKEMSDQQIIGTRVEAQLGASLSVTNSKNWPLDV